MKREFVINIILLVIINLLIKPGYIFGIEARIQNLVGTEAYGLYFDYFNFVFLFQFINDPGIQSWNAQFVPKVKEKIGYHFPKLLIIKFYFSIVFIVCTSILALIFGYERYDLILLLSINMIFSTLFVFLRSTIAGLGYYRTDSLMSAADKLIMIMILGYLAWISPYKEHFQIEALIYGQGLAYIIVCLIGIGILYYRIESWDWRLPLQYAKEKFRSFLPYTLVIFLVAGYSRLDGVMLGRMLDDNNYQAGLYATAFRFYDAANMVAYLFAALLLPMFAASLHKPKQLNDLVFIGLRFILVTALIITLSLSFYSMEFMELLYDEATLEFSKVLIVLISSFIMVAIAYIFGTLLVSADKIRKLNYLYGTGLILNFTLNYLLIPHYFALGAAVTTLLTQILIMSGQIYYAQNVFKLQWSSSLLIRLVIFMIGSLCIFTLFKSVLDYSWWVILILSIFNSLLLAFIFKIVDLSEGLSFLKKKIE